MRKSRHLIKRVPFMQLSIFLYYPARHAIRNIMQINNLEIKFPSTGSTFIDSLARTCVYNAYSISTSFVIYHFLENSALLTAQLKQTANFP